MFGHDLRERRRKNRRRCFTKFLELMKMSVQFQKPLVPLEWQAGHQRGSRCARAGHVSGYYGVAMQLAGHKRGSRCARAGHVSGYYGVAMQLNDLLLLLYWTRRSSDLQGLSSHKSYYYYFFFFCYYFTNCRGKPKVRLVLIFDSNITLITYNNIKVN